MESSKESSKDKPSIGFMDFIFRKDKNRSRNIRQWFTKEEYWGDPDFKDLVPQDQDLKDLDPEDPDSEEEL